MPAITFIEFNGTVHQVEVPSGKTLMLAAIENGVPGIDADCGGGCACGTCHVYIDPVWADTVGQADASENGMLNMRPDRMSNSRLSCQITLGDEHEGLAVRLPEFQM
jgi:2Fe-2S ferredoxin